MFDNLSRKFEQLIEDPVLRQWLIGRVFRIYQGEPKYSPHQPPYLKKFYFDDPTPKAPQKPQLSSTKITPSSPIMLQLPGLEIHVDVGEESKVFQRTFKDIETFLGLQRFVWLPLLSTPTELQWAHNLWQAWQELFQAPDDTWVWHPYTAAERAINIINFAVKHGLPGQSEQTLKTLSIHQASIYDRLEYFGDHHTSNHLSNNGRGIYFLGVYLGNETYAEIGKEILINEARRIFLPSGILREGSSHYHLLLTRNYLSAWLMAKKHNRPEQSALQSIALRAFAVVPELFLSAGLPLIGDISPDCSPAFLSCLNTNANGWLDSLEEPEKNAIIELKKKRLPPDREKLAKDGWLRLDSGKWSGLWHMPVDGWSQMPGHGHQDCGGFELHYDGEAILIDPGRGNYGESGMAAEYRSAKKHNSVVIDNLDPYPPNKPYYDDTFKSKIIGKKPSMGWIDDTVYLSHSGYSRLRGIEELVREWNFKQNSMKLTSDVVGKGRRQIDQYFYTPLTISREKDGINLKGKNHNFRLTAKRGTFEIFSAIQWTAYASGASIDAIKIGQRELLPWNSEVTLEVC